MLRFAVLALLIVCGSSARAEAQTRSPAGVSLGGALWSEIGGSDCIRGGEIVNCAGQGLQRVFLGGVAAFDLDLMHWLRLGLSAGIGFSPDTRGEPSADEGTSQRHWSVPLSLHSYWRVELGKLVTLWGGPEVGAGAYVITRRRSFPDRRNEIERQANAGFLAGVAIGLDVRVSDPLRLAIEVGQAVVMKSQEAAGDGSDHMDSRAVTRFALLLRYL